MNRRHPIEDAKHAIEVRVARHQIDLDASQLPGRSIQALEHRHERNHGSERNVPLDDEEAAEREDHRWSHRFEQSKQQLEPTADEGLLERELFDFLSLRAEAPDF